MKFATQVVDCLLRDELLERPLVDVLRGFVMQFGDVLDGSGKY